MRSTEPRAWPAPAQPAHSAPARGQMIGWLELFYDLAVVVLVAQAAHRLAGAVTVATWPLRVGARSIGRWVPVLR